MAAHDSDGGTLEQRLRAIEDRLEIYNLIATHPPSADTGAGEYTASVWTEDGVFDRGAEFPRPTGPAAIAGTSTSVEHRRAIEQGIAHFAGLPYVRVAGTPRLRSLTSRSLCRTASARCSRFPITGRRRGFTCTASRQTAGSSCAPRRAGRSGAGPCGRSTAARQRARSCAAHWRRDRLPPTP